jgi:flagellar hook-associated protein 1
MSSLLNVGATGLAAAYAGLTTAGHNTANVNTPGFSRQSTVQSTMPGQFTGNGFVGRGVTVASVQRAFDQQINAQVADMTSQSSEAATHTSMMARVDRLFAGDETGLNNAMDRFFSSITEAQSRPADISARTVVISSAQQFADRLRTTGEQLETLGQTADQGIRTSISAINSLSSRLAQLNDAIAVSNARGQPANDLLDQRDQLVTELSEQVGVRTLQQDDGSLNVFLSSGAALVVGNLAAKMSVSPDPSVPGRQLVSVQGGALGNAGGVIVNADAISGGKLSGLMKFRDESLVQAQNDLGRFAYALGNAYNNVHANGIDLAGNAGGAMFNIGAPETFANVSNTSGASLGVSVTNANALQASDYRLDFDGSNYTVTRLSDQSRSTFATMPATIDGLSFTPSSALAAGDSFTVRPFSGVPGVFSSAISNPRALAFAQSTAANDNRNATALAGITNSALLGSGTITQAYGEITANVGATTRGLQLDQDATSKLLSQAKSDQSSVSGVNLDEEAAKLMRYQQAYQASARVMSTAQTIFQSLLELGR